jgi:Protein of unknown function DUF262
MAVRVVLDAMIKRTDFATVGTAQDVGEKVDKTSIDQLVGSAMFGSMLRKPDFQRETNYWTDSQVVSFIESFANYELVPSAILWRSDAYIFVIDGGHRLSALRAWIEDDYGDGIISREFFKGEIPKAQKKIAEKTRKAVNERIGSYAQLRKIHENPSGQDQAFALRARNISIRAFTFQWVDGDANKAESSFFKINTQGTALDKVESSLLKYRKKTVAIAARSIVRAATGHKYWSTFSENEIANIEKVSKELHNLLFTPELESPIKTLDLPLGGHKSNTDALDIMIELFLITGSKPGKNMLLSEFPDDPDGNLTIDLLRKTTQTMSWIAGNAPRSLGLHPAVYYYSDRGRHIPVLFLGMVLFVRRAIETNRNTEVFTQFSNHRAKIEQTLVEKKGLILQALQLLQSKLRIERVAEFLENIVKKKGEMTDQEIVATISPNSTVISFGDGGSASKDFQNDTKSAIAIRQSLRGAIRCAICNGYLDPIRSTSYDHILPVREGGSGSFENGAMTHPFCNTGIKN